MLQQQQQQRQEEGRSCCCCCCCSRSFVCPLVGVRSRSPTSPSNPLVRRVVDIFDTNGDGKVSFVEFLVGLAKLTATTDDQAKIKFAFDVYDIKKDGYISNGELFSVMKMMVGNNLTDQQLQQLVDRTIIQADKDCDGLISYEEFNNMVSHIDVADKLKLDVSSM
eukprot:GHVU01226922.1.p1 GENE.GHVU01226922.1~~GHVU01226922.1.p1  ORF type:complete len:165 (-),score=47.99 GHVU01226922.1:697-1191(-)